MNSITQDNHDDIMLSKKFAAFAKTYRISEILRSSNAYKQKGIAVLCIFLEAFSMVFLHQTMYMRMYLHADSVPFGKQTFYRFLNSCRINWRRFTALLCLRIVRDTIAPLTAKDRIDALIVDDSLYARNCSKRVELLAKVFDHVKHRYVKGLRLLTLCWTDGNTTLPVSHCLLSTANPRCLINGAKVMDSRLNGAKQRKLAQTEAPEVVLKLLAEAKKLGFTAKHVLFDTWFCSPKSLLAIKQIGFYVIAMMKKGKTKYLLDGKELTVKEIFDRSKKRRGCSRYLLSVDVQVKKEMESIPARMVFVRNRSKRKEFLVLISTDMSLDANEIIRIYGKRWGIEVFFKMCKSYLRLTTECRSISYDAMTAHVAIVMTRYMMLAVEQRMNTDERSFGELFALLSEEMPDIRLADALKLLYSKMEDFLKEFPDAEEKLIHTMLDTFVRTLAQVFRDRLPKCA